MTSNFYYTRAEKILRNRGACSCNGISPAIAITVRWFAVSVVSGARFLHCVCLENVSLGIEHRVKVGPAVL